VLFILVQRPYGVGDRIHLSNPQNETSPEGSSGWIVEKVTLAVTTGERASYLVAEAAFFIKRHANPKGRI
jgi:small-conductance mechanosensitive channel